ncbi:unnamed protein product [Lactuca virosa]|uniref:Uncharacterized protein n=1 Tax=Lactuca virosa TaxID=75947 RepID=A0AAU9LJU1_9ASTR|nr:unnamed protein product [Lactuca virosa]
MSFPSLSLPSSRNPFLSHFFIPHRAFGSWLLSKGLLQSTSARFQKMKTRSFCLPLLDPLLPPPLLNCGRVTTHPLDYPVYAIFSLFLYARFLCQHHVLRFSAQIVASFISWSTCCLPVLQEDWLRLFVRYSRSTYWTKLTCRVPK